MSESTTECQLAGCPNLAGEQTITISLGRDLRARYGDLKGELRVCDSHHELFSRGITDAVSLDPDGVRDTL